jgi:hypothetical protein
MSTTDTVKRGADSRPESLVLSLCKKPRRTPGSLTELVRDLTTQVGAKDGTIAGHFTLSGVTSVIWTSEEIGLYMSPSTMQDVIRDVIREASRFLNFSF